MLVDLLAALREALGVTPSAALLLRRNIGQSELAAFLNARQTAVPDAAPAPPSTRISPLISHHRFNKGAVFLDSGAPITRRILTYLFSFDGLVIADPSERVAQLHQSGQVEQALEAFVTLCNQLADIEALLEFGIVRITAARPAITDDARAEVLAIFGLDPQLTALGNFVQAYDDAVRINAGPHSAYVQQAEVLLALLGMRGTPLRDAAHAREVITRASRALIHLSWQLAVAAETPSADVTLQDPMERAMLGEVIKFLAEQADPQWARAAARTQHVGTLWSGRVPHLDSIELTVADALAIRRDDSFASFRDSLHTALTQLQRSGAEPLERAEANVEFEATMRDAAERLRARVPRTGFAQRVLGVGTSTTLSAASLLLPQGTPLQVGAGLAGTAAVAAVLQWLRGRAVSQPGAVAIRYCTYLGGGAA